MSTVSSEQSPSAGAVVPPASIKRACDSCHRRKVKCVGEGNKPCKNCTSAGLVCTYLAVPMKKGPKGSRAKVLSELRETQRQTQLTTGFPSNDYRFEGRNISPLWTRTPNLLTADIANTCIEYYFQNLYGSQPILHRQRVSETVAAMEGSVEAYCLIAALCAFMMIQPNMPLLPGLIPTDTGQLSNAGYGMNLLEEVLRVRKSCNYTEHPTVMTVITSYYLYACYFNLDKQNTSWFHLREATTHAHSLGMHEEDNYRGGDPIDTSRRRRLYWLLFISERAYALHRHRPLTLPATIQLPSMSDDPVERNPLTGFVRLITLYKPFDHTFLSLWNKVHSASLPPYLLNLQQQLSDSLPTYLENTEVQAVDLRISQMWLKTMVWQLSVSLGFVNSVARDGEESMGFKYPVEMGKEVVGMSAVFGQLALEVHGVGLIEKLFDVACTLVDVLSCVPSSDYAPTYDPSFGAALPQQSPREYLQRFLNMMSTLRHGQNRFLPLLMNKIQEVLPSLYAQLNVPNPPPASLPLLQVSGNPYAESAGSGPPSSVGTLASPIENTAAAVQNSGGTVHGAGQQNAYDNTDATSSTNGAYLPNSIVSMRSGPPSSSSARLMNAPIQSPQLPHPSYETSHDFKTLPSIQQYGVGLGVGQQSQYSTHAGSHQHLPQPSLHAQTQQAQQGQQQQLPSPYGYSSSSMGGYESAAMGSSGSTVGAAAQGSGHGLYGVHSNSTGGGYGD